MSESINLINGIQTNKSSLVHKKHDRLTLSIKDYICLNGFRINRRNRLESVFHDQVSIQKEITVIKYSFFQHDYSLLFQLLELTPESISNILIKIFEEIFKAKYDNSQIIILP